MGEPVSKIRSTSLERGATAVTSTTSEQKLKEEIARLEGEVDRLCSSHKAMEEEKNQLLLTLDDVLNSKSWSMTAPIRSFQHYRRRIFPLMKFRRHRLKLIPHDLKLVGDKYGVIGDRPYLDLQSDISSLPTEWVELAFHLANNAETSFFTLYVDCGSGFSERDKTVLGFSGEKGAHLFRMPGTRRPVALRLVPFDTAKAFSLKSLELREKSRLQAYASILKRRLGRALLNPKAVYEKLLRIKNIYKAGGLAAVRARFLAGEGSDFYSEWVSKYDTITEEDRTLIRAEIEHFPKKPLISVVMPTYNTDERWLRAAIESVRRQLYQNWELCIADDASTKLTVREILKEYAAKDARIKLVYRPTNGHISEASNSALSMASGEFVALLDHDDELTEHALYMVVDELNRHPETRFLYSDEDKIGENSHRFNPYFKSDWNPELLLSQNYLCHLVVYRRDLLTSIGGFRKGFEGSQDWDIALRAIEKISAKEIRHIPHILYHWRVIPGSTAHSSGSKPYALTAGARAVSEHLKRRGVKAEVEILEDIAHYRIHYALPERHPLVSIIMPTKDKVDYLKRCVESILKRSDYREFEIIIVDNRSSDPETFSYFESLRGNPQVKVVRDDSPFNYSAINNRAVQHASGEILAFLNNDLEVITPEWLTEMVSNAVRPEVGCVGARLWFPNDLLQHCGVILGIGGVAGHSHKGWARHNPGYFNRACLATNFSAVTAACMLVRREIFEEVGGFEEQGLSIAFNDVDLSLRVREAGYLNLCTPFAELYHFESASRGYENTKEKFRRFEGEIVFMEQRWGEKLKSDPYYSPNLTLLQEDFGLAFPPRARKPWKNEKIEGEIVRQ